MSKNKFFKIIISGAFVTTLFITTVFASGTAGSSDDPIVTKSYVDSQVSSIMNIIASNSGNGDSSGDIEITLSDEDKKELVEEVTSQVLAILEAQGDDSTTTDNPFENVEEATSSSYVPVELQNGQVLLGGEGTEIILRSGSCVTYVSGLNGVVNATTGTDMINNQNVSKNNILIVPREDGRGVMATSDGTWFIVKGDYTIQ